LRVFQDEQVRHEAYFLTGGAEVRGASCFAIAAGNISHVAAVISEYFEGLKGSAYDGVAINHVLQMSSGARWKEDYSDSLSDMDDSSKKKIYVCFKQKR